ncbi:MAG: D-2-hydroxyacid dehydrogenase [Chloroflexi bacterium]|nr:D-2-hydroxyacid dehydrogenase [Chloroflexota bacterium]
MTRVLLTHPFPERLLEKIRAVAPQIALELATFPNNQWPDNFSCDAEVLYTANAIPDPILAPNLKWVQAHSAGVDNLVDTPFWHSDILLTSTSGIHAPIMAQYVFAQMLSWTNRVPRWIKTQQLRKWPKNRWKKFVPDELRGKTLGILGYGSIGREVARLAKSFGLKVLATKRDVMHPQDRGFIIPGTGDPAGDLPDRIYPTQATRSMVALCDYVVITLPLTQETHHLFDEALFKELKPSCFLINVGRGEIVDEKALVKALKKGWIAGAGLDVFEEEPLSDRSPLWQMENVILTPHVSGFTPHYDDRATDVFAENLRRYLAGEPLLNLVNREIGY